MTPPRIDELDAESLMSTVVGITAHVAPFNAAGTPCTAQPVPSAAPLCPRASNS